MKQEVKDCFKSAIKDEKNGRKHKGLLIVKPDNKIAAKYGYMNDLCKKAIYQCEEIVFSDKEFKVPKELYG